MDAGAADDGAALLGAAASLSSPAEHAHTASGLPPLSKAEPLLQVVQESGEGGMPRPGSNCCISLSCFFSAL
jgi:hypothetical protein